MTLIRERKSTHSLGTRLVYVYYASCEFEDKSDRKIVDDGGREKPDKDLYKDPVIVSGLVVVSSHRIIYLYDTFLTADEAQKGNLTEFLERLLTPLSHALTGVRTIHIDTVQKITHTKVSGKWLLIPFLADRYQGRILTSFR